MARTIWHDNDLDPRELHACIFCFEGERSGRVIEQVKMQKGELRLGLGSMFHLGPEAIKRFIDAGVPCIYPDEFHSDHSRLETLDALLKAVDRIGKAQKLYHLNVGSQGLTGAHYQRIADDILRIRGRLDGPLQILREWDWKEDMKQLPLAPIRLRRKP